MYITKENTFRSILTGLGLAVTSILIISLSSQSFAKEEYFRWKDASGTTHYGKTPPANVNSKKITTRSSSKTEVKEYQDPDLAYKKSQKEVKDERMNACEREKQRLQTLRTSGADIRMIDENGKQKILSQNDIQKEIKASENFIAQAC